MSATANRYRIMRRGVGLWALYDRLDGRDVCLFDDTLLAFKICDLLNA